MRDRVQTCLPGPSQVWAGATAWTRPEISTHLLADAPEEQHSARDRVTRPRMGPRGPPERIQQATAGTFTGVEVTAGAQGQHRGPGRPRGWSAPPAAPTTVSMEAPGRRDSRTK